MRDHEEKNFFYWTTKAHDSLGQKLSTLRTADSQCRCVWYILHASHCTTEVVRKRPPEPGGGRRLLTYLHSPSDPAQASSLLPYLFAFKNRNLYLQIIFINLDMNVILLDYREVFMTNKIWQPTHNTHSAASWSFSRNRFSIPSQLRNVSKWSSK